MAKTASDIPKKLFYKIGEVCEITDTQPYVLRFWESEFPQLSPKKNRSGQRVYQKKDIETVVRIKQLLYEEEYTIAGARKKLDEESSSGRKSAPVKQASRKSRTGEAEHPVDLLADRSAPDKTKAAAKAQSRTSEKIATTTREAELEAAITQLKASLREVLSLLGKR